jgi:hypothetical protein
MNASVTMGCLAFVILASSTSAYAHSTERVRRELESQGYDQIEFARTKFPVWVNACRGSERLHLHVDWYGKVTVTDETPKGSCPTGAEYENSNIVSPPAEMHNTVAKKTLETKVQPKNGPTAKSEAVGCKKYFPAIGMTVTVPCE